MSERASSALVGGFLLFACVVASAVLLGNQSVAGVVFAFLAYGVGWRLTRELPRRKG